MPAMTRGVIAAMTFLAIAACSSPDAPPPAQTAAPAPAPAPPPPVRVNESAATLPPQFVRDDIERVFQTLRGSGRSEFETTEAYRKRLGDESQGTLHTFVVEPFLPPAVTVEYDADRSRMVMRLWVKRDPSTTDINEDSITFPILNKVETSTYPASNAFGAQVQVQRTSEVAHAVAPVPVPVEMLHRQQKQYTVDGTWRECLEVDVPMPPEEARQRKDDLRFIILARTATRTKARTYSDNYEWKATISSPSARYTETNAVYVDMGSMHVWVADIRRGDILKRMTLPEMLKMKPRQG